MTPEQLTDVGGFPAAGTFERHDHDIPVPHEETPPAKHPPGAALPVSDITGLTPHEEHLLSLGYDALVILVADGEILPDAVQRRVDNADHQYRFGDEMAWLGI